MLLALDVGNSNTSIGLFRIGTDGEPSTLAADWRITTPYKQTTDEIASQLQMLFTMRGQSLSTIDGIAISSVVPPLDSTLRRVCETFMKVKPLFIEPGVKTGLPILTDNPSEVGADRVVNCVAAFDLLGGPAVVVDMGTATTFDVISKKGEFLGGAIAPGLGISADALFTRAARLTRVEIKKPTKVIGTSTTDNIQIGLYYGYIGLVDGILERLIAELGPETKTIATGGLAKLIAGGCKHIGAVDEMLTLNGLRLIWERNHDRHRRR
jgi:type III pantothenate kinase